MRKVGKILAGAMLGIVFAGAVGVYCWQYDVGGMRKFFEQEETESETTGYPTVKMVKQKVYELGEEVDCDNVIWEIHSAEIVEDYDSLDEYYHTRPGGLKNPSKLVKEYQWKHFEEEINFLVLKATLTNTSEDCKEYYFENINLYNCYQDGEYEVLELNSFASDIKCVSETGEIKPIQEEYSFFSIEGGETVELEYIIEYSEYWGYEAAPRYLYDVYLSTRSLFSISGNSVWEIESKIHLNIAPKHLGIGQTEPENTYDEQINIPEIKCGQWTNLEMKDYQKEGYPTLYQKEDIVREYIEEVTEENYVFDKSGITTQISNIQIVDWETLPQEYADRGALQNMAQRYEESYGYSRDQMKILLLDIDFDKPMQDASASHRYDSIQTIQFYWYSYLYTRDENEKRWVFGTADDWLVTKNSAEGGRTGHINVEQFVEGQTVTLQAAYLLPPEIYNEGALYFNGGEYIDIDYFEQPIQMIRLK